MEYKEAIKTIDKIIKAIKKGKYEVSIDEPNNIDICRAPDGRTFYKFVDMDGVKSSNDFGRCSVDVVGYSFTCDLGTGDYESDFFDELEDEYELKDGSIVSRESLEEKVIDAFNARKDIWFGEYYEMDTQMEIFAQANHIKDPEYYWCEDPDCPIDIDDSWGSYTAPEDLDYGTVFYQRCKYYLVEEPIGEDGEQIHAVHCHDICNDHGVFDTVLMTIRHTDGGKIKVINCQDCDDTYNAVYGAME